MRRNLQEKQQNDLQRVKSINQNTKQIVNSEDRRVRKTKKALREGFSELMHTKDIKDITIRELTDKVDIHRSTFYAHYEDIYDLYQKIEDGVIEELLEIITANFSLSFSDYYTVLINYAADNKKLCKMLFANPAPSFSNRLTALFKNACLQSWCSMLKCDNVNEALDYYAEYHLHGGFAMIAKWADVDFSYPQTQIIQNLADMDANMAYFLRKTIKR